MQPTQLQALRTQVQALQTEQERIQGRKSLTIPPEKLEIIKRDAEKGRPDAQYLLGAFYWYGANVPGNAELAVKWLMKAAAQGQSGAQSDLALAYVTGEGIAQDKVLAYAWFNLTAAQGDQNSARNLQLLAVRDLTRLQIEEAQRLSTNWKPGTLIEREGTVHKHQRGQVHFPVAFPLE